MSFIVLDVFSTYKADILNCDTHGMTANKLINQLILAT